MALALALGLGLALTLALALTLVLSCVSWLFLLAVFLACGLLALSVGRVSWLWLLAMVLGSCQKTESWVVTCGLLAVACYWLDLGSDKLAVICQLLNVESFFLVNS